MQKTLNFSIEHKKDALSFFKNLYYHLYSNSNVSRQEQIIEDLSKILLFELSKNKENRETLTNGVQILYFLKLKYPKLKNSISPFILNDESIQFALEELSAVSFGVNPSIIIGEAFQALIGPTLRGDKGQFFTPKSVVSFMISIIEINDKDVVGDPAAGTGGFLSEALASQKKDLNIIGFEKDEFLARISSSIFEMFHTDNTEIHNINSLDIDFLRKKQLLNKFDKIITNPPFGSKIGVKDPNILRQFDLGYVWTFIKSDGKWTKTNRLLKEQSPQVLFTELCIKLLKNGGKAGIVLPEGLFGNKSLGYFWDYLRQQVNLTELIDCPRTTFQPGTDTKTNIIFFTKVDNLLNIRSSFKVGLADSCGHNQRGNLIDSKGNPIKNDFDVLSKSFFNGKSKWFDGIVKDPYYLVPRYCIDKIESQFEDPLINVEKFISIGELISNKYIGIKKGNEVGSSAYGTGEIAFIRTSDISNFEINSDPTKSISREIYLQYKKAQNVKFGDILFVADGRYRIGRSAIILDETPECIIQSHIKIIKIRNDKLFSPFELIYLLNHKFVKKQIKNLIFIQSTLGSIGNRLDKLMIPIPIRNENWLKLIQEFKDTLLNRHYLLKKLDNYQNEVSI